MHPSGSELGFERLCCLIYLDHNEDQILVRNILYSFASVLYKYLCQKSFVFVCTEIV